MDKKLDKMVGFVVEMYPTTRDSKEPMYPMMASYQIYSLEEMRKFFQTTFYGSKIDKHVDIDNILKSSSIDWKEYLTEDRIKYISGFDPYKGTIWMHMKVSYVFVSSDTTELEVHDFIESHIDYHLCFDTEGKHYTLNEAMINEHELDHVAKPAFIIVERLALIKDSQGYRFIPMEKKITVDDYWKTLQSMPTLP